MIQGNLNDLFKTIIEKYSFISNLDKNNIYFLYNGKMINKEDET